MTDADPVTVTALIEGAEWAPGTAPVECGDCGAELSLGESCDHLAHTDGGVAFTDGVDR